MLDNLFHCHWHWWRKNKLDCLPESLYSLVKCMQVRQGAYPGGDKLSNLFCLSVSYEINTFHNNDFKCQYWTNFFFVTDNDDIRISSTVCPWSLYSLVKCMKVRQGAYPSGDKLSNLFCLFVSYEVKTFHNNDFVSMLDNIFLRHWHWWRKNNLDCLPESLYSLVKCMQVRQGACPGGNKLSNLFCLSVSYEINTFHNNDFKCQYWTSFFFVTDTDDARISSTVCLRASIA